MDGHGCEQLKSCSPKHSRKSPPLFHELLRSINDWAIYPICALSIIAWHFALLDWCRCLECGFVRRPPLLAFRRIISLDTLARHAPDLSEGTVAHKRIGVRRRGNVSSIAQCAFTGVSSADQCPRSHAQRPACQRSTRRSVRRAVWRFT